MGAGIKALSAQRQLKVWGDRVNDPRGVLSTGWSDLDALLNRGGLAPSTLCIFGGRTGTRKTTTMMNLIANFLAQGTAVGLIGLDEAAPSYVAKLASAMFGVSHETLESEWENGESYREQYQERAAKFTLSTGYRPDFEHLTAWMGEAEARSARPQVVFIDYISLLTRDKYAGAEVQRVSRLVESLQVWTNENEVVTIALHQVGRMDEGSGVRNHGEAPLTVESLKYGGEEIADIIFGSFRPAKDPFGNMTYDQAVHHMGDKFDEEKWQDAVARVEKYRTSTFLQLLKNRPGTRTCEKGIELKSVGESMQMHLASEGIDENMRMRVVK